MSSFAPFPMRAALAASLLAFVAATTACAGDDAGDGGEGGGPTFSTGPGPTSASAGPAGSTGSGSASTTTSTSSSSSSASSGAGGGTTCTPVTLGELLLSDTEEGGSSLAYALEGLDASQTHVIYVEFFGAEPQATGTFDLGDAPDDNYSSCAHCLIAFEDFDGDTPTTYFSASGTMTVTTADTAYAGTSAGTLADVVLEQVTLENTVTTPVPGGMCLRLADTSWDTTGG